MSALERSNGLSTPREGPSRVSFEAIIAIFVLEPL